MSEKMSRKEFSESLDRRLSGLQGDPWLRTKVLAKTEGEKRRVQQGRQDKAHRCLCSKDLW